MRLLTFDECAERLDPDRKAGITGRTLRGQLRSVRVGKRDLVPEPVFNEYCEGLLNQCQGETPDRASHGATTSPLSSSAGTSEDESASVRQARATIAQLKKPSRRSSRTSQSGPKAPVVPIGSQSRRP